MKLSEAARRMLLILLAALPLLAGGAAVYYRSWAFLPFAGGALLGIALNIAKVLLIERTARNISAMPDPLQASNYARLQSLLRFLLTGLALALPAFSIRWGAPPSFFWGTAAGTLIYQAAVYSLKLSTKKSGRS